MSFIMMLSLALVNSSVETATIIGWIGVRVDDIATMLIIGFSPLILSVSGQSDWVPERLYVWGLLAGICGFLGVIALFTGIVSLGFVILPVGIGWMLAAGVVLINKSKSVEI